MVSPASKDEHLKHLKIARAAGFNYVRLHTHCELPEYFEAADEAGIMIQPELPYYGNYPTEAFAFDPMRDLREVNRHYRRYVSLTTYCTGNEGLLGKPLDQKIYRLGKRLDPDRLMIHQDGGLNEASNSDFRSGPMDVWEPGSFKCDAPFVAHEYLNLCVKQDPRLEPRFSAPGCRPSRSRCATPRSRRRASTARGATPARTPCSALQSYYQKHGIESARLDPACDGYDFWTIVDVVVQQGKTYSSQGLFNAFWGVKSNGTTPEAFRLFNGPTALLLKTAPADRIAVAGDTVKAAFWIAHYGTAPVENAGSRGRCARATTCSPKANAAEAPSNSAARVCSPKPPSSSRPSPSRSSRASRGRPAHVRRDRPQRVGPLALSERDKQDGRGIAVSKDLLPALESSMRASPPQDHRKPNRPPSSISRLWPFLCPSCPCGRQARPPHQRAEGQTQRQPRLVVDGQPGRNGLRQTPSFGATSTRRLSLAAGLPYRQTGSQSPAKRHEA